MKNLIKRILPSNVFDFYRRNKKSKFEGKAIKDIFSEIHTSSYWNKEGSISGTGSDLLQTKVIISELNKLFIHYGNGIKSILDIPCGDFNWMQRVDLEHIIYIGGDIVDSLIQKNRKQFAGLKNVTFEVLDLTSDLLPETDLVIVRDCLVHLSYDNIFSAIKNLQASHSKYLLATSFIDQTKNHDIKTGEWRALNMQKAPFNLPKPILTISEKYKSESGKYDDKSLCLWEIKQLT